MSGIESAAVPVWRDADDLRWAARHWATRIGVRLRQVHIRSMTNKWASMSTAGRLTLDPDILTLPQELGEYIIVHELVHLLAPNHGKVFKSFMLAYLPNWAARDEALRTYAAAAAAEKRGLATKPFSVNSPLDHNSPTDFGTASILAPQAIPD